MRPDADFNSRCNIVEGESPEAKRGPMLVLIPGGPGFEPASLRPLEALKAGFDLCFLDPAGTGKSTPRVDDYEHLIQDIENCIHALGRDVVLVGHSFGGIVEAI